MPKLSKIDLNSSPQEAVNAIRTAEGHGNESGAANRIALVHAGEGQGWAVTVNGAEVTRGSIPLDAHNSKNLKVALGELIAARDANGIAD
nr:hypothetical protein [uncultured Rhodopila sp.]